MILKIIVKSRGGGGVGVGGNFPYITYWGRARLCFCWGGGRILRRIQNFGSWVKVRERSKFMGSNLQVYFRGGGVHSNLGCRDTFLKIVSLLENYRSEWGKSIHFWKALCTGFPKIPKSLP